MARHFTAAGGDYIDVAPGSLSGLDGGPWSLAILWRPSSNHDGCFVQGVNAGGYESWMAEPVSDGRVYHSIGGSYRACNTWSAADGWRLDGLSKASGTDAVRGHQALLGGAWSHTDYTTAGDTTNVPTTAVRIGRLVAGWNGLNGDIAALAICGAVWSDATFESLSSGLAAWVTATGAASGALWAFNQASASDPLLDLTGGGADQVAISGTSISTDPPGWSYALGSTITVTAAASLGPLSATATATRVVNAAAAAALGPVTATAAATVGTPAATLDQALVDAGLDRLRTDLGLRVYPDAEGVVPLKPSPPYVRVYAYVERPPGDPGNALSGTSRVATVRWYVHCVGANDAAALAVAARVRARLLDVRPTVTGRECGPIRQEAANPPARDESTGVTVVDQLVVYRMRTT